MADTPTSRSKRYLEKQGYTVGVVERWVPQTRKRIDLFGFADLIAMRIDHPHPLLVQTTSGANVASRRAKIEAEPKALIALNSGFRIHTHGWRRLKVKRGGKAVRWSAIVHIAVLSDLPAPGGGWEQAIYWQEVPS